MVLPSLLMVIEVLFLGSVASGALAVSVFIIVVSLVTVGVAGGVWVSSTLAGPQADNTRTEVIANSWIEFFIFLIGISIEDRQLKGRWCFLVSQMFVI